MAWAAYWVLLVVSVARPALVAAIRALSAPQGHGTMGASVDNGILTFTVKTDALAWSGSSSLTAIALWIAGPPLLLWMLWLATRTRPMAARERTL
jgi:hypothetical protein